VQGIESLNQAFNPDPDKTSERIPQNQKAGAFAPDFF
jgi:hypothetical protein